MCMCISFFFPYFFMAHTATAILADDEEQQALWRIRVYVYFMFFPYFFMACTATAILADNEEQQAFGRFYVTSKWHMGR